MFLVHLYSDPYGGMLAETFKVNPVYCAYFTTVEQLNSETGMSLAHPSYPTL